MLVSAVAALALVAAACSSSKSSTPAGGGAVTIEAHAGPLGTYLTNGQGVSLYLFASDTSGKSTCTGACLTTWPAVTGTPTAGSGVTASLLGTITDSNGAKQVTYNGHPLYTYTGDSSAGETNGQGTDNFGAKWWLVAPNGNDIMGAGGGGSSSSSSSSSSGGGGGGWS